MSKRTPYQNHNNRKRRNDSPADVPQSFGKKKKEQAPQPSTSRESNLYTTAKSQNAKFEDVSSQFNDVNIL